MNLISKVYGSLKWKKTDEWCASKLGISLGKYQEIKRQILQTRELLQTELDNSLVDLAGKRMLDLISDEQIKDEYISELINKWYDLILVHGDERMADLTFSFSKVAKVAVPIFHTGYIVRQIPNKEISADYPLVLVSVAAGRLGNELLDAIIDSHLLIKEKIKHKLVLFSGAFQKDFSSLKEKVYSLASLDINIYCFDGNEYLKYLSNASLVISLGGYNSIIESIAAKKTMLVYQRGFSGVNKEQDLRITLFEKYGSLSILKPEDLDKESLSNIIVSMIEDIKSTKIELNFDGVKNSINALLKLNNDCKSI